MYSSLNNSHSQESVSWWLSALSIVYPFASPILRFVSSFFRELYIHCLPSIFSTIVHYLLSLFWELFNGVSCLLSGIFHYFCPVDLSRILIYVSSLKGQGHDFNIFTLGEGGTARDTTALVYYWIHSSLYTGTVQGWYSTYTQLVWPLTRCVAKSPRTQL